MLSFLPRFDTGGQNLNDQSLEGSTAFVADYPRVKFVFTNLPSERKESVRKILGRAEKYKFM
jgi:hypothetical protein